MITTIDPRQPSDPLLQLVSAFRRHGTRWYEADDDYDMTAPMRVEALLIVSPQFRYCNYTEAQARAKAAIIARAAMQSGSSGWVGHPDNDPLDTAHAIAELSARLQAVVDS